MSCVDRLHNHIETRAAAPMAAPAHTKSPDRVTHWKQVAQDVERATATLKVIDDENKLGHR